MAKRKPKEITRFDDLKSDDRNANKGTERGSGLIEKSLRDYGAGRSILADRNGKVIAGNKTLDGCVNAGIQRVRVVQTDGNELVVVQRTDLDLDKDKAARELAIVDNRAGQVSLEWDGAELLKTAEEFAVNLNDLGFAEGEIERLVGQGVENPQAEWEGMPEFTHQDKTSFQSVQVHFKNQEDVDAFAKLIDQKIGPKTRFLWYPHIEIETYADKRYAAEQS